jgi:hypothetical protein
MGAVVSPSPPERAYTRADFALPEGDYLFLVNFVGNSIVERKNPLGAVGLSRAFPEGMKKQDWSSRPETWRKTRRTPIANTGNKPQSTSKRTPGSS